MITSNIKYFHTTEKECKKDKAFNEIIQILNNEYIIKNHHPKDLKAKLISDFSNLGWIKNKNAFSNMTSKIQLYSRNIGLQIQFGNKAWVRYDILKLCNLQQNNEIDYGVIVLFEKALQVSMMGGVGNFEGIVKEYDEYKDFLDKKIIFIEVKDG